MLLGQTVRGVVRIYMIFVMITLGFFGFTVVFDPFVDMTVSAAPTSHYVSPDGAGNYTTIQDAIDNSSIGDTIHVWSGTYDEHVTINHSISLIGNGTENTSIDPLTAGDAIRVTSDWVNITGFRIESWGSCNYSISLNYVENCSVINNNFSSGNYGINLYYSENNVIKDNFFIYIFHAIDLQYSYNNSILNNTFYYGSYGIYALNTGINHLQNNLFYGIWSYGIYTQQCEKLMIFKNFFQYCRYSGIRLYDSKNIEIFNNTFILNEIGVELSNCNNITIYKNSIQNQDTDGVWLDYSLEIILRNNSFINDGIYISGPYIYWITHDIDTTNTISGKPIYYIKNQQSGSVPANAGQVILANSSNIIVKNQDIHNIYSAGLIGYCQQISLSNCNFSNNLIGITLYSSKNNTIKKVNLSNCEYYGIYFEYSNYNYIEQCDLNKSNNGINIFYSYFNTINNSFFNSQSRGIYLYSSQNNTISNSSFHGAGDNIYLRYSLLNIIDNNSIQNGVNGIYIISCFGNNSIINNDFKNNYEGIYYYGSSGQIINNTFEQNGYGIYINIPDNIEIRNNQINNSDYDGIQLLNSDLNIIDGNNVTSSSSSGIYVLYSNNITITNNTCTDNEYGIWVSGTENNSVKNNIVTDNYGGITIQQSQFDDITDNYCCFNSDWGLRLQQNKYQILKNNNISKNQGDGLFIQETNQNYFYDNTCNSNNFQGICSIYSEENLFENCNSSSNKENGLFLQRSNLNIVKNSIFSSNWEYGQFIQYSDENQISNNTCNSNGLSGMGIEDSDYNIIRSNTCQFNNQNGIKMQLSTDSQILENNCSFNTGHGILNAWHTENIVVANNSCIDNKEDGILVGTYSDYNLVRDNFCILNNIGLRMEGSLSNVVLRNIVNSNEATGLLLYDSSRNTIKQNTIAYNNNGIQIATGNYNQFYHNLIIDNYNDQATDQGDNSWDFDDSEGNYWSDYNGSDIGGPGRFKGDGIGDTNIPHLGLDSYPFIRPWGWIRPPPPILVDPGNFDDDGEFVISWLNYKSVDGFILHQDISDTFNSTNMKVYDLAPSQFQKKFTAFSEGTYYFRIRAYIDEYKSEWSNTVDITVHFGPSVPANFQLTAWPEGNCLNLSWTANTDDIYVYELQVKTVGDWKFLEYIPNLVFRYDHIELTDGIEYFYRLRAWDYNNRSSQFTPVISGIPEDTIPPSPPNNLIVLNKTCYSTTIKWSPVSENDLEGYNIFRSKALPLELGEPINGDALFKGVTINDTGLAPGTTYFYVIKAYDEVPNESEFSEILEVKTYTLKEYPQPPQTDAKQSDIIILEDTIVENSIDLNSWFYDVNEDLLSFKSQKTKHIEVIIDNSTGLVTMIPQQDWNGNEILTFTANDGTFEVKTQVKIIVTAVNDPPTDLLILSPEDNSEITDRDLITLECKCNDADIKYGDILTYNWSSDLDGDLGLGEFIENINLSIGKHRITLIVTDSENSSISEQVNITVSEIVDDVNDRDRPKDEFEISDQGFLWIIIIIIILVIIIVISILVLKQKRTEQSIIDEKTKEVKKFSYSDLEDEGEEEYVEYEE